MLPIRVPTTNFATAMLPLAKIDMTATRCLTLLIEFAGALLFCWRFV
jgi:hypothetical protein